MIRKHKCPVEMPVCDYSIEDCGSVILLDGMNTG